jgi:hypothetical protein
MRLARLTLVPAVLLTAGCLQGQRVIKINPDGSGTIVDTVKLGDQAKGMLAGLEQMDKTPPADRKAKKKAKLEAKAAQMGEGVTLLAMEDTKEGGERLTWSFKDVSKIRIDTTPTVSSNDSENSQEPLTFRWARPAGGNSTLTVVFPKPKPGDKAEAPKNDDPQGLAMMKGMLAGLKMSTVVEVKGTVVKTTSPYQTGSSVTLLDIDFDAIDEAGLKALAASDPSQPPSPELLKKVKGVKASTGEVVIEFK